MLDLHLPHCICSYSGERVILERVSTPQDHFRSYARVIPCSDSGLPDEERKPEGIMVDDAADRARLEDYFRVGGGVVRLHCRGHGPYQHSSGLGPR